MVSMPEWSEGRVVVVVVVVDENYKAPAIEALHDLKLH